MRRLFQIAAVVLLVFARSAFADAPVRVQDPAKFGDELFSSHFNSSEIAKKIATAMGKADMADTVENALKVLDGKKIDFTKKVIDKDFNNALRQIVYYSYVENLGFIYFRLNFKMTSTGWILANFNFKSEASELFPKDFVEH